MPDERRLFVFDIDGVMVRHNKPINKPVWYLSAFHAVRLISSLGNDWTIATTRNWRMSCQALGRFRPSAPAILQMGARIMSPGMGRVMQAYCFTAEDKEFLLPYLRDRRNYHYVLGSSVDNPWQYHILVSDRKPSFEEGFASVINNPEQFIAMLQEMVEIRILPTEGNYLLWQELNWWDDGVYLHVYSDKVDKSAALDWVKAEGKYNSIFVISDSDRDFAMFERNDVSRLAVGENCAALCVLADRVIKPWQLHTVLREILL